MLAGTASLLFWSGLASAARLTGLEIQRLEQGRRIVLQLDSPFRYRQSPLAAVDDLPCRHYVDLYDTRLETPLPDRPRSDAEPFSAIRAGYHGKTLRLVIDLRSGQVCQVTREAEARQLVVTILPELPQATAVVPLPAEKGARLSSVQPLPPVAVAADTEVTAGFDSLPAAIPPADFAFSVPRSALISGQLLGFGAADLADERRIGEDRSLWRLRSRLALERQGHWRQDQTVLGRLALEWDVLDYDNAQAGSAADLNLYEAFVRFDGARWDLTLGRQRVRWGKTDQLSPLDSLNPEDLRQGFLLDLEERKRPSWLARLRLHGEQLGLEAVVQPWFERSELDYFDSDWALYRNLRQAILNDPQLPAEVRAYAAQLRVREREPADRLENVAAALRLSWRGEAADYALSYRYGWETLPHIRSFPVKGLAFSGDPASRPAAFLGSTVLTPAAVEARYRRQQLIGFEWEAALADLGFRGELAYCDQVSLLAADLTTRSKKTLHLVSGIDYSSLTDWYFNLQLSWYRIFAYERALLYFERDNLTLLGEARKTLWRGRLELATRVNYSLTDGGSALQPLLRLKYFAPLEWESGLMIFMGGGETLLGSYDQADQVYTRIKLVF
ncbi:DUF1302 family protein [Desulfuromonas thiophila]|uniref:DUF1302 family protein n=1 Tax=Desulfuromonas thiophila TaxID=57664 RepID=UPI0024A988C8|nr:DUF1302 family protein [Desulfuromonas thiophila]